MYFDNAAATAIDSEVLEHFNRASSLYFANPGSIHSEGLKSKLELDRVRTRFGEILDVKTSEVVFTSSTSESNNLAIFGLVKGHLEEVKSVQREKGKPIVICFKLEHDSVKMPLLELERQAEIDLLFCPSLIDGSIDLKALQNLLEKPEVFLLALMSAQNEIGTIQPLSKVAEILARNNEFKSPDNQIKWHLDAAQSVQYLDIKPKDFGITSMSFGASKIYGIRGVALLYLDSNSKIKPLIYGGGQERGLRSSTISTPLVSSFLLGLEKCKELEETEIIRLRGFQTQILSELKKLDLEFELNGVKINESKGKETCDLSTPNRLPNNLNLFLPKINPEEILTFFDLNGIQLSAGSGCHSSSLIPSTIRQDLGLEKTEGTNLRISMGRFNTKDDVNELVRVFAKWQNLKN